MMNCPICSINGKKNEVKANIRLWNNPDANRIYLYCEECRWGAEIKNIIGIERRYG